MEKEFYEKPVIKKLNAGLMNKFGVRTEYAPLTHVSGVSVKKLIEKYGSPVFVISEQKIRSNCRNAASAFKTRYPKVQFAWSYKTNYISAVCNVFHQEGAWAEVVSGFEYKKAISNGVPGSKIIFNGPYKTEKELLAAISNYSMIHIDHMDELCAIAELAKKTKKRPRVAIRVNMDTGIYPMWDRFGFNFENGQASNAISKILAQGNIDLVGLHTHIGTFIMAPGAYAVAVAKLSKLAAEIKEKSGKSVEYIDLGGGFASKNTLKGNYLQGADSNSSIDEFAEAISTAMFASGFKKDELPLLILETGRALIDDTACLLGTVVATKLLSNNRRAVIVDIGVNILFTSLWYDHKISPAQEFTHHSEDMSIYGPLCMNIDMLRESVNLPLLKKGDHIVVQNVGAYNMTQWMQFITLRPKVIMIDTHGQTHIIRKNEVLEDIASLERVPPHLMPAK